jgi:A/G-specific adenine glycosylase
MLAHLPLAHDLLHWYDLNARTFPWRFKAHQTPDPYHVWLSEMMLQQTNTTAVIPYFQCFLEKWPTLQDLAASDLDEVLHAWQGLGYYARARNLHACARRVCEEYQGQFPQEEEQLRTLPGIGPYTAAAITAIAFRKKATPIDGNIIRVISRLFGIETSYPQSLPEIQGYAEQLTPETRTDDFAQALMDLGSTVCMPKNPKCSLCPWQQVCLAFKESKTEELPRKLKKKPLPVRYGIVFWLICADGRVTLNRRPEKGLLGGMIEFPSTPWREEKWTLQEALPYAPEPTTWAQLNPLVRHTFTHFHLELTVLQGRSLTNATVALWDYPSNFVNHALPTVMKKVASVIEAQH